MISIFRIAYDIRVLGPGNRFCVWVQGCDRKCPGCMSRETWDTEKGKSYEEDTLANTILSNDVSEMTISGGEPFLQSHAIARLLQIIHKKRDVGVIVYTGYTYEELKEKNDIDIDHFLEEIDLLIDGPYIEDLDDGGAWRGSSNQRAICLTDRYISQAKAVFGKPNLRLRQMYLDENGLLIVGLRSKPKDAQQ